MALNATALEAMTPADLDRETGLQTRGDDGWERIVKDVRDAVIEANNDDRWDIVRRRDDVIHELADGLVPAYTRDVVAEFRIIGAAWSADTAEIDQFASLYDDWSQTEIGQTSGGARCTHALYIVYRVAVAALVETLEEIEDEDEDEDTADDGE